MTTPTITVKDFDRQIDDLMEQIRREPERTELVSRLFMARRMRILFLEQTQRER